MARAARSNSAYDKGTRSLAGSPSRRKRYPARSPCSAARCFSSATRLGKTASERPSRTSPGFADVTMIVAPLRIRHGSCCSRRHGRLSGEFFEQLGGKRAGHDRREALRHPLRVVSKVRLLEQSHHRCPQTLRRDTAAAPAADRHPPPRPAARYRSCPRRSARRPVGRLLSVRPAPWPPHLSSRCAAQRGNRSSWLTQRSMCTFGGSGCQTESRWIALGWPVVRITSTAAHRPGRARGAQQKRFLIWAVPSVACTQGRPVGMVFSQSSDRRRPASSRRTVRCSERSAAGRARL